MTAESRSRAPVAEAWRWELANIGGSFGDPWRLCQAWFSTESLAASKYSANGVTRRKTRFSTLREGAVIRKAESRHAATCRTQHADGSLKHALSLRLSARSRSIRSTRVKVELVSTCMLCLSLDTRLLVIDIKLFTAPICHSSFISTSGRHSSPISPTPISIDITRCREVLLTSRIDRLTRVYTNHMSPEQVLPATGFRSFASIFVTTLRKMTPRTE